MAHTNLLLFLGWAIVAVCILLAKKIQQKKAAQTPPKASERTGYSSAFTRFKEERDRQAASEDHPLSDSSNPLAV